MTDCDKAMPEAGEDTQVMDMFEGYGHKLLFKFLKVAASIDMWAFREVLCILGFPLTGWTQGGTQVGMEFRGLQRQLTVKKQHHLSLVVALEGVKCRCEYLPVNGLYIHLCPVVFI